MRFLSEARLLTLPIHFSYTEYTPPDPEWSEEEWNAWEQQEEVASRRDALDYLQARLSEEAGLASLCLMESGAHGYSFQTLLVQRENGASSLQAWSDVAKRVTEQESTIQITEAALETLAGRVAEAPRFTPETEPLRRIRPRRFYICSRTNRLYYEFEDAPGERDWLSRHGGEFILRFLEERTI